METYRPAIADTHSGKFRQTITIGPHVSTADEPVARGGQDNGPRPFELLAAGLAACTSMTVKSYAETKRFQLTQVRVEVTVVRDAERVMFDKVLRLEGDLDDAERARLLAVSKRCPVHKALMGTIAIESRLV